MTTQMPIAANVERAGLNAPDLQAMGVHEIRLTAHRCQCAACGKYFSRSSVFDKHRTGDYGGGRRCMTTEEMGAKGMRADATGVWRGKAK